MPFFPRILVHLVGLGDGIGHGRLVQGLLRQALQAMSERQQFGAVQTEFTRQLRRGDSLSDAAQDQHDLGWRFGRSGKHRPREGVEDAAAGTTAVIQHRFPMPTMNGESFVGLTSRTGQPIRMQQVDQFGVTGILVHEVLNGEIHEIVLDRSGEHRIV